MIVVGIRIRLRQLQERIDITKPFYQFQIRTTGTNLHGKIPFVEDTHLALLTLIDMYIIM